MSEARSCGFLDNFLKECGKSLADSIFDKADSKTDSIGRSVDSIEKNLDAIMDSMVSINRSLEIGNAISVMIIMLGVYWIVVNDDSKKKPKTKRYIITKYYMDDDRGRGGMQLSSSYVLTKSEFDETDASCRPRENH